VILFLIGSRRLRLSLVTLILEDFLSENNLSPKEIAEVKRIKSSPAHLTKSYLLNRIKPYALPFYEGEVF